MRRYDLPAIDDGRKSFYGKAIVEEDSNGKHLYSYNQNICNIDENGKVTINTTIDKWNSTTSIRHIKAFLKFFNKASGSKAEIIKNYC